MKEEQKKHLIDMMEQDEKLGLYEQETLEEAIENPPAFSEELEKSSWNFNQLKKLDGEFLRSAFIEGAKWQEQRMCDSKLIQKIRATLSDAEARRIIKTFKKK